MWRSCYVLLLCARGGDARGSGVATLAGTGWPGCPGGQVRRVERLIGPVRSFPHPADHAACETGGHVTGSGAPGMFSSRAVCPGGGSGHAVLPGLAVSNRRSLVGGELGAERG